MTKRILILNGIDIDIFDSKKHWGKLKQNIDVEITFKNINDRIFAFGKKKYDLIIINAHGELKGFKESGSYERDRHRINTAPDADGHFKLTAHHIRKYAQYSDIIFLATCYGGAVMKDLYQCQNLDDWKEALKFLKVIAPVGSKHKETSFDLCHLEVATRLLQMTNSSASAKEELVGLGRVCPDTICMRDRDGGVYKLTALKIEHGDVDGVDVPCIRYFCKTNSLYHTNRDIKFWEIKSEESVFAEDFSDEFKTAALCAAVSKGKVSDAKYFLVAGADVERSPSTLDSPPLSIAASNGNLEMVKLLIDFGANPQPNKMPPTFLAALELHWEVVDFLLDRLTPEQLNTNKDFCNRYQERNDPIIEDFLTRINQKLSELSSETDVPHAVFEQPRVARSESRRAI
jgi:hypothetical protein